MQRRVQGKLCAEQAHGLHCVHALQDARWTKALKYMLTDLKWCMSWVIGRQEGAGGGLQEAPAPAAAEPGRGGMSSAASSMHRPRAEGGR